MALHRASCGRPTTEPPSRSMKQSFRYCGCVGRLTRALWRSRGATRDSDRGVGLTATLEADHSSRNIRSLLGIMASCF